MSLFGLTLTSTSAANSICAIPPGESELLIESFAVVSAPDGYVNVRRNNAVVGKLVNGTPVFVYGAADGRSKWCDVHATPSGLIHDSGLTLVADYASVPILKSKNNVAEFANKDVRVWVTAAAFDKNKHRLVFNKEGGVVSVDGRKDVIGIKYLVPHSEFTSIKVQFQDKTILLPKKAFQNLFDPHLGDGMDLGVTVNYDKKGDALYIYIRNGDASDYNALLIIKNKAFIKQYVIE